MSSMTARRSRAAGPSRAVVREHSRLRTLIAEAFPLTHRLPGFGYVQDNPVYVALADSLVDIANLDLQIRRVAHNFLDVGLGFGQP